MIREFRTMSLSHIMDKSMNIHKKHIWTSFLYLFLITITAIPAIIIVFPLTIFILSFLAIGGTTIMMSGTENVIYFITGGLIFVFFILVILLFQMVQSSGLIKIGSQGFFRNNISAGNAYAEALKSIPRILSVLAAGTIIFIPLLIFMGVSTFIVSVFLSESLFGILLIIISSIISLFFMTYLIVIHIFSLHTSLLEKRYFFDALKRSRELVKGKFWYILGCSILFGITSTAIVYSIYSLVGLIGGIFGLLMEFFNVSEEIMTILLMNLSIIRIPLEVGVSFLTLPIGVYFITLLYYNQRFKREGFDIRLETAKMKRDLNK